MILEPRREVECFPDRDAMTRGVAEHVVERAREAIAVRGRFLLALSGGSTPQPAQARYLESIGVRVQLRRSEGKTPFRTDEGHLILDCTFGAIERPRELAARFEARAGIVEHGLFLGIATDVLVGHPDGVRHLSRNGQAVPR